jgi:hypothetical protein
MPRRDARAKILAARIYLGLSRCAAGRRPAPHSHAAERGLEHLKLCDQWCVFLHFGYAVVKHTEEPCG